MLEGHSLIYFAPEDWDGLWRNRQQLMSVFARHNRVVFVEPRRYLRQTVAGFREGTLGASDLTRPLGCHIADNLYVWRYPVWAPISGRDPLRGLTRAMRRRAIVGVMRQLRLSRPIVWLSRPNMLDLLDEMPPPGLLIYHVVDEYAAYAGRSAEARRHTEAMERELLSLADLVIVVSPQLYEAKRPYNAHTHLVPNGVNYQAYVVALNDEALPRDLQAIPRPRLGYSGLIGDRLDFGLLKALAEARPEWSLVFLGEARAPQKAMAWEALLQKPNVHYLGQVAVDQVPHYLKGFDVGLMPYARSRESEHISPLKVYDYLAAGLPIASVDIPAARQFAAHLHLAHTPSDFITAVQNALADTSPARFEARRKTAQQHTWEARAEALSRLMAARLEAV